MTAQKIRAPRRSTFGFEKLFLRPTECAQPSVAGDNNLLAGLAGDSRMTGYDCSDKLTVDIISCHRLIGVKFGMIIKLSRHTGERKAAVRVLRFRVARLQSSFTGQHVHLVFPDQFIWKIKAVACKFKTSHADFT